MPPIRHIGYIDRCGPLEVCRAQSEHIVAAWRYQSRKEPMEWFVGFYCMPFVLRIRDRYRVRRISRLPRYLVAELVALELCRG